MYKLYSIKIYKNSMQYATHMCMCMYVQLRLREGSVIGRVALRARLLTNFLEEWSESGDELWAGNGTERNLHKNWTD